MRTVPVTYIVKVTNPARGRRIIVKREFTDYDMAMEFLDHMEELHGQEYTVEFLTTFGYAAA